jgi:hypothetical protein
VKPLAGCPKHPVADGSCHDVRCRRTWKPEGAPTLEEQTAMWVRGKSVCPNDHHECCPDFSCCRPELQWPDEKRQKFAAATQGEREKMLMGSLGAVIAAVGVKGRVTRGDPTDDK